jgi:hypothetical protein
MADFNINLAHDLASTARQRHHFYKRMLFYLVGCGIVLVLVAYLAGVNMICYLDNRQAIRTEMLTTLAVAGLDAATVENPAKLYAQVEQNAAEAGQLRAALGQRSLLLPVVHDLFSDLTPAISVQSLVANNEKIEFGLVLPPANGESGDLVSALRTIWEQKPDLVARVESIRAGTAERRTVDGREALYVQFECILRK